MIEQEKIEKTLKDIHLLFAASETLPDDDNMVIVNKKALYNCLEEINRCMYDMMDSYEIVIETRERNERKSAEKCESMISESRDIAEEIYAAAVMYTDDAMKKLYDEIRKTQTQVVRMTENLADDIDKKLKTVVENRAQLREQLSETEHAEKYLRILRNQRKKDAAPDGAPDDEEPRKSVYRSFMSEDRPWDDGDIKIVAPAPKININPAYAKEEDPDLDDGVVTPAAPNIVVNYDSEYFKQKRAEMGEEDFEEGVIGDVKIISKDDMPGKADDTDEKERLKEAD